jgi:preprotein translocase subunit SecG
VIQDDTVLYAGIGSEPKLDNTSGQCILTYLFRDYKSKTAPYSAREVNVYTGKETTTQVKTKAASIKASIAWVLIFFVCTALIIVILSQTNSKNEQKDLEVNNLSPEQNNTNSTELNKKIEDRSMNLVIAYECKQLSTVRDVSAENKGYDLVVTDNNGIHRFIEVKGKLNTGAVVLTHNEYEVAKQKREAYYLYIVENVLSNSPSLRIIKNPYESLHMEPYGVCYSFKVGT